VGLVAGLTEPCWYAEPPAPDPFGPFGDPATNELWARNANAGDLAMNFGGIAIRLFSGNGIPCGDEDPARLTHVPTFPLNLIPELPVVRETNDHFDAALTSAGVAHTA